MEIYIILLFFIVLFGAIFEKKNKQLYSVIIWILFTSVAALRHYSIGNDTYNYVTAFNNILTRLEIYGINIFNVTRMEKRLCYSNVIN